ncbi:MAG: hypothetical protein IJ524_03620 [Bacteroidales bacterium]|nr:hypothetical protein [Bacteroidales bacterium]
MKSGLLVTGSVKAAGVTFYIRKGETIVRAARTRQPRRNTRKQFEARMKMRHTTALWRLMGKCDPMFEGGKSVYARFASLANRLPAVYLDARMRGATLLIPGMPMSDGSLPEVKEWLGEVGGTPALRTDLRKEDMLAGEVLRFYSLRQHVEGRSPQVHAKVEDLKQRSLQTLDGCVVLTGEEFADPMMGWALVRVAGDHCSPQSLVSQCSYYEQFTTEAALTAAAESYGGLTKEL